MLDLEGIGNNIKRLRIENNLSQEELASKLFLSRQAISLWEKGNGFPSIDNVVYLSKLFNVSIERLLLLDESFVSLDEYFLFHSKNYHHLCAEVHTRPCHEQSLCPHLQHLAFHRPHPRHPVCHRTRLRRVVHARRGTPRKHARAERDSRNIDGLGERLS